MVKKKTLVIAFLASPQGQKMLKQVYTKLDTPKNREKLQEFAGQFKTRATELKDKHGPKVEGVVNKAKAKADGKFQSKLDNAQEKVDDALTDAEKKAEEKVDDKPSGDPPAPSI